jgi:hypothetical protein
MTSKQLQLGVEGRGFRAEQDQTGKYRARKVVDHAANSVAADAMLSLFAIYHFGVPERKGQTLVPDALVAYVRCPSDH